MSAWFYPFDSALASARYRQIIPARELLKLGVEISPDSDTIIVSKHGWPESILDDYKRVIFDICDDHFKSELGDFYRRIAEIADKLVCNSDAMRFRIFQETGKVATVIPDPYELEHAEPSFGEGLLWFGHPGNLGDLNRVSRSLADYKVTVVSDGGQGTLKYSKETLLEELEKCACVILPTGKSPCKSANRMIEAIRRGKFVVANPLPAYEPFESMWVGDIREGVDWAHRNRDMALLRIREAQEDVRINFSPALIGGLWKRVLEA